MIGTITGERAEPAGGKKGPAAPPYPADTRAKGWRFEFDYEKIEQSDTWGLAAETPMARPFLVMMWLVAWTQNPCGSLPNDEAIIRARCSIPASVWPKVRDLLMRDWWLADDGRLYHNTVSTCVLEMIEYRRKNAMRVANFKAAQREQHGGNALPTAQQLDSNDTGTGTGTGTNSSTPSAPKKGRKSATPHCPDGVDPQVYEDWLALRKARRSPVTETVIEAAKGEAAKADMTLNEFLKVWCARGTTGLQAEWLKPNDTHLHRTQLVNGGKGRSAVPADEARRAANAAAGKGARALLFGEGQKGEVIEQ